MITSITSSLSSSTVCARVVLDRNQLPVLAWLCTVACEELDLQRYWTDMEPLQSTTVRRSAAEWVKDHTNLVPISTIPPPREIPYHLRRAPDHPPRSRTDGTLVADTLHPRQDGPSPNVLESFTSTIWILHVAAYGETATELRFPSPSNMVQ